MSSNATDSPRPLISEEDTEATIRQRYQEEVQASRKLEGQLVALKRKLEAAQKENDESAANLARVQAIRTKLESVCRQLQRQNRAIEDESLGRMHEDEAQRKELSEKFHHTIEDVTQRMGEHSGDRDILAQDHKVLLERIANLKEQLTLRDQHYEQQLKTKDLQAQLMEARLRQQAEAAAADALRREERRQQIKLQHKSEDQLRQQLCLYGEKFDQFHNSLENSNNAFQNFQRDLALVSDRLRQSLGSHQRCQAQATKAASYLEELQRDPPDLVQQARQAEALHAKLSSLVQVLEREVGAPPPVAPPTAE